MPETPHTLNMQRSSSLKQRHMLVLKRTRTHTHSLSRLARSLPLSFKPSCLIKSISCASAVPSDDFQTTPVIWWRADGVRTEYVYKSPVLSQTSQSCPKTLTRLGLVYGEVKGPYRRFRMLKPNKYLSAF